MTKFEPLERRVLACAWAPQSPSHHAAASDPPSAAVASAGTFGGSVASVAAVSPAYNTPFLTDAQLEQSGAMTAAEIRAFLAGRGSYFRQTITDVDGVSFDPATAIASAAAQYRISPKVILATLQKEHSGVTRTTRPSDSQMRFLMGCKTPTTARHQFACAAERFRSYHDSLASTGSTVSGWRVGVAKTTQDGVSVTPATRAVAGQFTYTPYAGAQWGGNLPSVGGVYLFYNWWNGFGFADSARPTAASNPGTQVAAGASTLAFSVTYADAAGVDVSDIVSNNAAVRVTGPNGYSRLATFVGLDATTDGTPRTATYRVAAPGGAWDAADAGTYAIRMEEAQVSDVNNNFVAAGTIGTLTVVAPATVTGRHVLYNNSGFDGNGPALAADDDAAAAADKVALRPGQVASFSNVTSFTKGITAIRVDLLGGGGAIGAGDFTFRAGSGSDATWAAAPAPTSVLVRPGAGPGGATRVTLAWPDGALRNTWLQVTVKATVNTRLTSSDVFYFGNLPGDTGGDGLSVDGADVVATRAALLNPAADITNPADHTRDGRVDAWDLVAARANFGRSLYRLGQAPAGAAALTTTRATEPPWPQLVAPTESSGRTPRRRGAYLLH